MRRLGLALLALLSAVVVATAEGRDRDRRGEPGDFDLYVLALTWSPSWCEAEGDERRDQQCARPFAFVVHGLWPQWTKSWPQFCDVDGRRVPDRVLDTITDVIPSRGLAIHQWVKHGACSGLSPTAYFDETRKVFQKIVVPERFKLLDRPLSIAPADVEKAFAEANPGLDASEMEVTCDRRRLREVRICLKPDLSTFVPCPKDNAQECRARDTLMPAVRGR